MFFLDDLPPLAPGVRLAHPFTAEAVVGEAAIRAALEEASQAPTGPGGSIDTPPSAAGLVWPTLATSAALGVLIGLGVSVFTGVFSGYLAITSVATKTCFSSVGSL